MRTTQRAGLLCVLNACNEVCHAMRQVCISSSAIAECRAGASEGRSTKLKGDWRGRCEELPSLHHSSVAHGCPGSTDDPRCLCAVSGRCNLELVVAVDSSSRDMLWMAVRLGTSTAWASTAIGSRCSLDRRNGRLALRPLRDHGYSGHWCCLGMRRWSCIIGGNVPCGSSAGACTHARHRTSDCCDPTSNP